MADAVEKNGPEAATSTPLRKNNGKSKQKHRKNRNPNLNSEKDTGKVQQEKAESLISTEPTEASGPVPSGSKGPSTTPDRPNRGVVKPSPAQQKGNHSPVKKGNYSKSSLETEQSHEDDRNRPDLTYSRLQRERRDENKIPIEVQRRRTEEERSKRWHIYFNSNVKDLLIIDRMKIVILSSVHKGKPLAQFHCPLCNYYCDNMAVVRAHIAKPMHQDALQDYKHTLTLRKLPEMSKEHLNVLNNHLQQTVTQVGMDPADLENRRTIEVLVSNLVTSNLKGCSVRLFGSSIHGMGLKSSDVNIDLQVPNGSSSPLMLKEVSSLLQTSDHFKSVQEHFDSEFPYVSFVYNKSEELCSISLNNERAINLATLLSKYTPLDPRLTQLATLFRYWGKLTQTDKAQDGTWPAYALYLMTIFYLQRCEQPVLPVLHDMLVEKEDTEIGNTMKVLNMAVDDIKEKWKTKNTKNLASLWVGLLKFYTVDFNSADNTISIDSSTLIERRTKKIFIVDPFLPTRNVARSIISDSMFYYIQRCLLITGKYYCMPQTAHGPLFGDIYVRANTHYHPDHERTLKDTDCMRSQLLQLNMGLDPNFIKPADESLKEEAADVMEKIQSQMYINIDNIPYDHLQHLSAPSPREYRNMQVSRAEARMLMSNLISNALEYNFSSQNCTGGEMFPKVCSVCREDHLTKDCRECILPPLRELCSLAQNDLEVLNSVCWEIFGEWRQYDSDIEKREEICAEFQNYIRKKYPTAKLELFGSTKNGFGLKDSDMDICLTFEDNPTGEEFDARKFVEDLSRLMRDSKAVIDVLAIATAKVPIVKFTHKATRLDGDISTYNVLAMENSKLLSTYSCIDDRVRVLGYMMKRFAKVCHIGDASKGSLSSYAYTLLVIFYLQRCQPPVLPVLQELTESGDPPPAHLVEGCNAYFFNDLEKLDTVWKGKDQNKLTVGELWCNLLIFYSEKFDMMSNVISIRCSKALTKFEKMWGSKTICIEDPFDVSHNLGSALSQRMSLYIIKCLRMGRNHFGTPVYPKVPLRQMQSYYFDVKLLTVGDPPNDRGCRFCKSIGHKERDCPEKRKNQRQMTRKEPPLKKEDNFEVGSHSAEETRLKMSHHRMENPLPRMSKENPNPMQNPEFGSAHKVLDGSPQRVHSKNKKQYQPRLPVPPLPIPPRFRPPRFANRTSFSNYGGVHPPILNLTTANVTPARMMINPPPLNQCPSMRLSQSTANNHENGEHIPSIVFNNSKLSDSSVNEMRYQLPPNMEYVRPPPGFVPPNQNGQRPPNSASFSQQQRPVSQASWNFEENPFISSQMMRPHVDFTHNAPTHSTPPICLTSGASTRPPVCPPFNHLRHTGMMRTTEQRGWVQLPLSPNQPPRLQPTQVSSLPYVQDNMPIVSLSSSVENMHMSSQPLTDMSFPPNVGQTPARAIQQNMTEKAEENSSSQYDFLPNNSTTP